MRQNYDRNNTWLTWRSWGRTGFSNEWNDGCFVPPTSFFSITSSLQLKWRKGGALWFDASLLITTPAPWLGCFTPAALHCYIGMSCGPGCLMSHMSAKGTRTFMKASAPLLRRRSTWHGGLVNCYLYRSTTIVLLFRTIHRYKPDETGKGGIFPAR